MGVDQNKYSPLPRGVGRSTSATSDAVIEFASFRLLLRRRELLADGIPVELGTRTFDLLLVLVEADGSLVTKEELLTRVWPDIVVSEENLKVQVAALRKSAWRGPRYHPHGIWPWLSLHRRAALECLASVPRTSFAGKVAVGPYHVSTILPAVAPL
jgi:hypothetical protein